MGLNNSKPISCKSKNKKDFRIVLYGLDGAGKTAILYKLRLGEMFPTNPTDDFNVETVEYKDTYFKFWDIGGRVKISGIFHYFFQNTSAVVFVVDASDRGRVEEAKEELHAIMTDFQLENAVLLVFANKQDKPNAMDSTELAARMNLNRLSQKWHVHGTSAQGNGLYEGLDYLLQMLECNEKK